MLEIERENNESANGPEGASDQTGGSGRGLLRRARRAVTRPAGPPAAEPPAAPAGQGTATHAAQSTAEAATQGTGAPAAQAPAAAGAPAPAEAASRATGQPPAAGQGDGQDETPAGASRTRSSRSRAAKSEPSTGGEEQPTASGRRRTSRRASGPPDQPETESVGRSAASSRADQGERQPEERPAIPVAAFQPPLVIFQPPEISAPLPATGKPARQQPAEARTEARATEARGADDGEADEDGREEAGAGSASRRRRRGGRGRGKARPAGTAEAADGAAAEVDDAEAAGGESAAELADEDDTTPSGRRRRRRRRSGTGADADGQAGDGITDDPPNTVVHVRSPRAAADTDVRAVKGSTRLEAKRQRRREGRESGRRRPPIITESEFLARREAVERVMVVRQHGDRTQIAVLEDGVLVEHYVDKASHQSYVGNVYLGKVQNVLPSMEAAFVDIGKGRNAVLYAGEVNFDASGLEGESKRIESALKSGQSILVQVTKDPIGHKGARLTSQVSLPGRYLVYVPGASMTGISRKLPDTERTRLKQILKQVMPENAGVIVRTAAEGASEDELSRDVARLSAQWEAIEKKAKTASAPDLLYSEPDLTLRVVRDIFNEDFSSLVIASDSEWDMVDEYVRYVAPHLADRMRRWDEDKDVFETYRIDEQLAKALERKVWLPSGGSLVIDHTEAMTVIDVNTGKFTGQGGNLEQTVTRNNLEAAEEIVRQLRLRDLGGIIVIDFIDMVLESNRELVLRRLLECLARDRTKHQVAEVTSLGLVQMTRKRVGSGLLEAFSVPCEHCNGRGVIISLEPVDHSHSPARGREADGHGAGGRDHAQGRNGSGRGAGREGPNAVAAKSARSRARSDGDDGSAAGGSDAAAGLENGTAPTASRDKAATTSRSRSSRSRSRSGSREPASAQDGEQVSAAGVATATMAVDNGDRTPVTAGDGSMPGTDAGEVPGPAAADSVKGGPSAAEAKAGRPRSTRGRRSGTAAAGEQGSGHEAAASAADDPAATHDQAGSATEEDKEARASEPW